MGETTHASPCVFAHYILVAAKTLEIAGIPHTSMCACMKRVVKECACHLDELAAGWTVLTKPVIR